MKSMFLKAAKAVALSLVLAVGASSVAFANGGGATPTRRAHNGGGNGAGSKHRRHHRVSRRLRRR